MQVIERHMVSITAKNDEFVAKNHACVTISGSWSSILDSAVVLRDLICVAPRALISLNVNRALTSIPQAVASKRVSRLPLSSCSHCFMIIIKSWPSILDQKRVLKRHRSWISKLNRSLLSIFVFLLGGDPGLLVL